MRASVRVTSCPNFPSTVSVLKLSPESQETSSVPDNPDGWSPHLIPSVTPPPMSHLCCHHLELPPISLQGHLSAPCASTRTWQGTGMQGGKGAVPCGALILLLQVLFIPHVIILKIRKLTPIFN